MIMLPTDRLSYSPITERSPLKLPDGARLAVWVIVNVEEWDPRETMPRTVLTPPAGAESFTASVGTACSVNGPVGAVAVNTR